MAQRKIIGESPGKQGEDATRTPVAAAMQLSLRLRLRKMLVRAALRLPPIKRLADRIDTCNTEITYLRSDLAQANDNLRDTQDRLERLQQHVQANGSRSNLFTAEAGHIVALSADLAEAQARGDAAHIVKTRHQLVEAQARLAGTATRPSPVPDIIPAVRGSGSRSQAPSLFFVSLPKSGTVYTWNMLSRATGLRMPDFQRLDGWGDYTAGREFCCPALYACGDYHSTLLRSEAMAPYMQGFVFGAHMQPSHHNMSVLKEAGIERITLLLRDPRDAFVSWVHHVRALGPSALAYHSKLYHLPDAYYDWPLAEQFAHQIRTFLPSVVNWVEGWLDYCASPQRAIAVQPVYYDELKTDPRRYIRRIAEFHGIDAIDLSAVRPPQAGALHYRRGEHAQWRTEFSERDRALAAELMQDRIACGFDRAGAAHPGMARAAAALDTGRPAAAAAAALDVVRDFPNHRPAYRLVQTAAALGGIDVLALNDGIAHDLTGDDLGDNFLYRFALIDACEAIAEQLARPHRLVMSDRRGLRAADALALEKAEPPPARRAAAG